MIFDRHNKPLVSHYDADVEGMEKTQRSVLDAVDDLIAKKRSARSKAQKLQVQAQDLAESIK
jgi:hypothetical protein